MASTLYLRPSADVTLNHTKNTGNSGYALISEVTADGDSTYIYQTISDTSSSSKESTFTFSGNIGANKIITSATMYVNAKASSNGDTRQLSVNGGSAKTLTTGYTNYSQSVTVSDISYNSSTGDATVNLKIKTTGKKGKNGSNFDLRVTQAYVELVVENQYVITGGNVEGGVVYVGTSSNPSTTSCIVGETGTVYVKCTPNTGYSLTKWQVSGGSTASGTDTTGSFKNMTGDCTVGATFALVNYTISTAGSNGTVYVGTSSNPTTTSCTATILDTVYVKCTPNSYYNFGNWKASGGSTASGTTTTGSFTNVNANTTVTGTFNAISYTVTGGEVAGGTIYVGTSSNPTTTSCSATHAQTIYVKLVAQKGYGVTSWSSSTGTASGTSSASGTISGITNNTTVTGVFSLINYTISTAGSNGTVYVGTSSNPTSTSCTATIVDTVYVKCTPNSYYNFGNWKASGGSTASGTTTTGSFTSVSANTTVTGTFNAISYDVSGGTFNGGTVYVGTSANPTTTSCKATHTQTIYVKCTSSVGYSITNWSSSTGSASGTTTASGTISGITNNTTVTGVFSLVNYTISTAGANGTVYVGTSANPTTTSCTATILDTVYVKCAPNSYYNFTKWQASGGSSASSTSATGSFTSVSANTTVTGSFTEILYTISGGSVNHGTIYVGTGTTPASTSCQASHFQTVNVRIVPELGYNLTSWATTNGTASSTTSLNGSITNLTDNATLSANFSLAVYNITTSGSNGTVYVGTSANPTTTSCTATIVDTVYVKCVASDYYSFNKWQAAGGSSASSTSATGSFTSVSANTTVTGTFNATQYSVSGGNVTHGTIYVGTSSNPTTTSCNATHFQTVYVKIVPNAGYSLTSWASTNGTTSGTTSVNGTITNLVSTATLSATFSLINYTLTGSGTNGTVYVGKISNPTTTSCVVTVEDTVYVKCVPVNDQYTATSWSTTVGTKGGTQATGGTITSIAGNGTVTGVFTIKTYTITTETEKGGRVYVGTSPNPSATSCTVNYTQTLYVRLVSDAGYEAWKWSSTVGTVEGDTLTNIRANGVVTGWFDTIKYKITANTLVGADIYVGLETSPTKGSCIATVEDTVYVKLNVKRRYIFNNWTTTGTCTTTSTQSTTEGRITRISSDVYVGANLTLNPDIRDVSITKKGIVRAGNINETATNFKATFTGDLNINNIKEI